ncbi:hypothetical protein Rsub_10911 [Raphidocelis subcapitata]|uniref:Ig-like domain-containing protein n=1 Tax=Raphidocelis subcapitata TaxID=307507 RepID=A0A2V0PKA1_9CHLO|nr:hypothetical protein Rsub_10911 [Raphidocelis subcapitata]|eukprot:GBF97747.1 hypothetical protein Rsub_10911 [Raphidocelis subcapitata]
MGTRVMIKLLGLLALVAVARAQPAIQILDSEITEIPNPPAAICKGPVVFNTTVHLTALPVGDPTNVTVTPSGYCTTTQTMPFTPDVDAMDLLYTCEFPPPGDNITTAVTFKLLPQNNNGTLWGDVAFDLDPTDDITFPTFTAAFVQVPRVRVFNLTQIPQYVTAGDLTAPIAFDMTVQMSGITSPDNVTRVEEPAGCTLLNPSEGLDAATNDFDTTVMYRCSYAQRSSVPASITFTGNTNMTSPTCFGNDTLNLRSTIKEQVTLAVTAPLQQCTAAGVVVGSTLVEYQLTATVSGAKTSFTIPPNCTTAGTLNAYGVGTLAYSCRYLANNVSVTHNFVAVGDSGTVTRSVTFPAVADGRQPAVLIGTVEQALLLPRASGVTGNADTVQLLVPVTMERAFDVQKPAFCDPVTNITGLLPSDAPGYTGTVVYNCTVPIASVTTVSGGSTTAPPTGVIDGSLLFFKVTTPANGCFAIDRRNQTVVHEPAVAVAIGTITQGCSAAPSDPITYKVPVTFTGAKGAHTVAVPEAPAACKESVGTINSNGYGMITYDCTFASAAAANATLNFTSTGLITGETRWASQRVPTPVAATRPEVEITNAPAQSTLLRYYDSTSRVDISLAVRFKGAVGGMYRSMGSLCRSANDSSVVDRDGVLEFNCTFARPADVPANFTFRSLTNAADCYAEDTEPFVVKREPRVGITAVIARQECLAALTGPVSYDVEVLYEGAKKNHSFPLTYCTEDSLTLDANGTGPGKYTCTFANSTSLVDLAFSATGIIAGDTSDTSYSLEAAVPASRPSVKIDGVVQDLLMASDNSSEVKYTVSLTVTGAEVLSIYAEDGRCNATTVVPLYLQDPRLLKLVPTATTKIDLLCGFKNASVVPKSITFTGHTNASGCIDEQYTNITVKRQAADDVKPYAYKMRFEGMTYGALVADAAKMLRFVEGVRGRVSLAVGLPVGHVQVVNITEGSVIADVVLQTPSTWTPEQVIAAANTLASPADVFDATFLREWDITAVTVTRQTELPAPSGLSTNAKIGIGVGVGVGGGALIGTGVGLALARKRRSAIEPRDMA